MRPASAAPMHLPRLPTCSAIAHTHSTDHVHQAAGAVVRRDSRIRVWARLEASAQLGRGRARREIAGALSVGANPEYPVAEAANQPAGLGLRHLFGHGRRRRLPADEPCGVPTSRRRARSRDSTRVGDRCRLDAKLLRVLVEWYHLECSQTGRRDPRARPISASAPILRGSIKRKTASIRFRRWTGESLAFCYRRRGKFAR